MAKFGKWTALLPLPLKVFVSYVAVVTVGALPIAYYFANFLAPNLQAGWVIRVALAMAISAAILLSLAVAVAFSRPLRRIADAADLVLAGDPAVRFPAFSNGEIGRVAAIFQRLATELRKRQAQIEAGRSMLEQLVESMSAPVALIDPRGRMLAVNDAARDLFESTSSAVEGNLRPFLDSELYHDAVREAEALCEPVPVVWANREGRALHGWAQVLRQPDAPSFVLFLGRDAARRQQGSMIPPPEAVESAPLRLWLAACVERAQPAFDRVGVVLSVPEASALEEVSVSDVQGRAGFALSLLLESAIPAAQRHRQDVKVDVEVHPLHVLVTVHSTLQKEVVAVVRSLLKPLGSHIKLREADCALRVPRA